MSDYSAVCEEAARAGGAVLLKMRGKVQAREKGPADLVTEADFASQAAIFGTLSKAFPDHGLLGEENAEALVDDAEFTWIVDPLDGTTNYVHGLENYCVSVALRQSERIIAATIYDPVRDHCYRATRGGGAFLNDTPIRTSEVREVSQSLIAASFSAKVPRESPEIQRFLEVLVECQAIRRLGSAALNMCYVACGKLDAYWATSLKQWDVAAGLLIVEEAGGVISDIDRGTFSIERPRFVAAGQRRLADNLLEIFSQVKKS